MIPDIEKFLPVAIFKMATTMLHPIASHDDDDLNTSLFGSYV
jgi:hypothetical protein